MPFRSSGRGAYGPQGQRVIKGPLAPVWVTSGTVINVTQGQTVNVQLSATDDSGDAPTYTLASGTLPGGVSLSSSGLLSGTTNNSGTFTFTVRATDVNGRFTDSSTLTAQVAVPVATVTFQADGTTLGTATGSSKTIDYTGNWSTFTVSGANALLDIEVRGGSGGRGRWSGNDNDGAPGGIAKGRYTLAPGTYYYFVGEGNKSVASGGAGGGSTDIRTNYNGAGFSLSNFLDNTSLNSRFIVGGGGGGPHGGSYGYWGATDRPGRGGPNKTETNSAGNQDSGFNDTGANANQAGSDGGSSTGSGYAGPGGFGIGGVLNSYDSFSSSGQYSGRSWPNGGSGTNWANGGGGGGWYGGAGNWPNGGGGSNILRSSGGATLNSVITDIGGNEVQTQGRIIITRV